MELETSSLTRKEEKLIKQKLKSIRNLEKYEDVMTYIEKHKVYASMTSSPDRLRKSSIVVSIILLSPFISKFYINLPEKYRNKETYKKKDVKYIESLDSRIKINWLKKDIGPISKILPTLKKIKDEKSIVISFDDDVFYPPSLVNELIFYSVRKPNIIFGGGGFSFGDMEDFIERDTWPEKRRPKFPYVDVIEGWGGIAYKKEMVNIQLLKKLNNLDIVCKLSDDLTLSFCHSLFGIKRKVISNRYFSGNEDVIPLQFGLGEGALHKGSGNKGSGKGNKESIEDANMEKYKKCKECIYSKLKI